MSTTAPLSIGSSVRLSPLKLWPVIACWLAWLILTVVGLELMHRGGSFRVGLGFEICVVSFILGQFALGTIIGGLLTRAWIASWGLAVILASLPTISYAMISDSTTREFAQRMVLCAIYPALFLSTCAPLIVLRTFSGWTLSRQSELTIQRTRLQLEDLILLGVIIACSITLAQWFFYVEGRGVISELLIVMAVFAAISLVCVPPVVYISFALTSWTARIVGWLLLTAVSFAMVFGSYAVMRGGLRFALSEVSYMLLGVPVGCMTVCIGLIAMIASGYRLTRFESRVTRNQTATTKSPDIHLPASTPPRESTSIDTWLAEEPQPASHGDANRSARWQARAVTAAVVLLAGIGGYVVQGGQRRVIQMHQQLLDSGLRRAYLDDQGVVGLEFPPEFSDDELAGFTRYAPTITSLSFQGTKVTDAILKRLDDFIHLHVLDLSHTAISDAGLANAQLGHNPLSLNLADTKISWSAARQLTNRQSIQRLNLSGLGIVDEQLTMPINVQGLTLSRNPITDQGIKNLLATQKLSWLDVSDTSVSGSSLTSLQCPETLILDGTQIDDTNLLAILNQGEVQSLSIARTKITAAVLPKLSGLSVRLGEGPITERDLSSLKFIALNHLGLNAKQFTGSCLAAGTISTQSLDLSNSSVTDQILLTVMGGRYYQYVGLANTSVTDAVLPHLAASELDLRGTKVTAKGLLNRPIYGRVIINHDQFSPAEMARLKNGRHSIVSRPELSLGPMKP